MANKQGRWAPGEEIPNWMIDKVVLPLAERGYLSYGQLGIDPHADRMSQIAVIHRLLTDEASIAGDTTRQGYARFGATAAKMRIGGQFRDLTFGSNPVASSNLRGNDSAYLQIVNALQTFHRDNHIGQEHVGDIIASGNKVGGRTLAALNPQTPMSDVQVLDSQQQRVLQRQQFTVTADPLLGGNLNQIRHWFPQIPAKIATALAYDGHTVNDKMVQDTWRLSMNDKANPYWQMHPDIAATRDAGQAISYADVNPQRQKEMEDQQKEGIHPVTGSAVVGSGLLKDIPGIGGALSDAANASYSGLKGAFRWADAGLAAPMQMETGGLRDLLAGNNLAADPFSQRTAQSSAGIALGQLARGDNVDMGSGFFVQGQVAQTQAANSRKALSINGHAWTIGRGAADLANEALSPIGIHAVQPGSVGYNAVSGATDFANAYYLDPANAALSAIHNAHTGAQVISAVEGAHGIEHSGAINALRRTINPMTALQTIDSPKGRVFSAWAAGEDDFNKINRVVKDVPTALRLKDAQSTDDVNAVLREVYGKTVRNRMYAPPTAPGMHPVLHPFETIGYEFHNMVDPLHIRALGMKPSRIIDPHDPNQAVLNTGRALDNASTMFHGVDHTVEYQGVRMPATEAMARASQDGAPAMLSVAESAMNNIGDELRRRGFGERDVKRMTKLFNTNDERGWLTAENADHADAPFIAINGDGESLGGAKYPSDFLNSVIPLPDAGAIKRATSYYTSPLGQALHLPGEKGSLINWADKVNNGMRSVHVLRPAIMLRTVAQAQLMSALGGFSTIGKHPLEWASYVIGNPVRPRSDDMGLFEHFMSKAKPTLAGGLNEDDFAQEAFRIRLHGGDPNEFEQAMSGNMSSVLDKAGVSRHHAGQKLVEAFPEQGGDLNPEFVDAWVKNLARYGQDRLVRYHEAHGPEETKAWLGGDEGASVRNYLAGGTTLAPGEKVSRPLGFDIHNTEDLHAYVDSIEPDMAWLTGNDPQVRNALGGSRARLRAGDSSPIAGQMADQTDTAAFGRTTAHVLDDEGNPVPLYLWNTKGVGSPTIINPKARAILEAKAEAGIGPTKLWTGKTELDDNTKTAWTRAYDWLWSRMADQPMNRLNKSPDFSQAYWNRVIELTPMLSPEEAAKAVDRAIELNAPNRIVKKMRAAAENAGAGATLSATTEYTPSVLERQYKEASFFNTPNRMAEPPTTTHGIWRHLSADDTTWSIPGLTKAENARINELWKSHTEALGRAGIKGIDEAHPDEESSIFRALDREMSGDHADSAMEHNAAGAYLAAMSDVLFKSKAYLGTTADKIALEHQATWDQVDHISKDHALGEVKRLSYDFSNKSQFFDSARLLFPFGDAFRNIASQSLKLGIQNPRVVRRIDQAAGAGRSPSLIGAAGDSPNGAFLYSDPTTGQEVFNYPGSQYLTKFLAGVDAPLSGQISSLNVAGQGLPGVGFMGAIPIQFARQTMSGGMSNLFDRSFAGTLYRDWVTKNGELPGGDPVSMAVNAFLPPWANRLREIWGSKDFERQHLYTLADIERYKMSTGEYSTPGHAISEDQMKQLKKDAGTDAWHLSTIRAIGSLLLPSAPYPQWQVIDADGKLAQTAALADSLTKLYAKQDNHEIDSAPAEFVRQHGLDVYGAMTSLSSGHSIGLPTTKKQGDWLRNNPGLKSDYPAIYGLFAPPDEKGKYDKSLYQQQLDDKEREPLNNDLWMRLGQKHVAQQIYDAAVSEARRSAPGGKLSSHQQSALAQYRRSLAVDYPGFGDDTHDPNKPSPLAVQTQIYEAIVDPKLKNSPVARGLREYLTARAQLALTYDQAQGKSADGWDPLTSADGWVNSTDPQWVANRSVLGQYQDTLAAKYKGLRRVFDLVYRADGQP